MFETMCLKYMSKFHQYFSYQCRKVGCTCKVLICVNYARHCGLVHFNCTETCVFSLGAEKDLQI